MAGLQIKSIKAQDEKRPFGDKGDLGVLRLGDTLVGVVTCKPGWRWSTDVAPIADTESCEKAHTGYCLAGRMLVRMDDGEEQEIGPGDAFTIEPGHDAWVTGTETFVALDFGGLGRAAQHWEIASREAPATIH